jgi:snurportin-1
VGGCGGQEGLEDTDSSPGSKRKGILEGTKLKGGKAREFYSQQLMLPEWMVDIPINLKKDWCIMARPAGQRCLVIAANGSTISRQRNGRILHCFPSALPNGARTRDVAAASHVYCILDCIFHAVGFSSLNLIWGTIFKLIIRTVVNSSP